MRDSKVVTASIWGGAHTQQLYCTVVLGLQYFFIAQQRSTEQDLDRRRISFWIYKSATIKRKIASFHFIDYD
jgi:hypothetical protein